MGLLDGKKILVTGVLTEDSIAFAVAQLAQLEGAELVLTGAGRGMSLTERMARRLPQPTDVLELDVTNPIIPGWSRPRSPGVSGASTGYSTRSATRRTRASGGECWRRAGRT